MEAPPNSPAFKLQNLDTTAANQNPTSRAARSSPSPLRSISSQSQPHDSDEAKYQQAPSSPVKIHTPTTEVPPASSATIEYGGIKMREASLADEATAPISNEAAHEERPSSQPYKGTHVRNVSAPLIEPSDPLDGFHFPFQDQRAGTPTIQVDSINGEIPEPDAQPLQYHHEMIEGDKKMKKRMESKASLGTIGTVQSSSSDGQTVSSAGDQSQGSPRAAETAAKRKSHLMRPASNYSLGSELSLRTRSASPQEMKRESMRPTSVYGRNLSAGRGGDGRPVSMMDLLNIPYAQQMAHQMLTQDNAKLQSSVGQNASLLDTKKTLDMYRANVKKTNDSAVQYEFALFLINAVQEASGHKQTSEGDSLANPVVRKDLIKEARAILQRIADRGYAYAQYYLGDGYASGFFNGGKPDNDKAFSLFVAAGKHGHAEAGYRAALCYEFGWGSRRDIAKAVQYHRSAAAKGHPGAAVRLGKACLTGDMGLHGKYREGVKWLKRATENADAQHNAGPYELGLLHIHGYGADVFKDESYAAQLLTQAADLGHAEASLRMGEVYEHGLLGCPKDPALSIHFYNGAAQAGLPDAMMALCAWYMVGAEPVMAKDEAEAYEWAKRAADLGLTKAEYALGYFTEMGIGCRRDPLEANTWYMKAAEQGDDRAKHRLAIIRAAESGETEPRNTKSDKKVVKKKKSALGSEQKDDKDCIIM